LHSTIKIMYDPIHAAGKWFDGLQFRGDQNLPYV
jgi:hypothetical protein